jgi:hypothetical protein
MGCGDSVLLLRSYHQPALITASGHLATALSAAQSSPLGCNVVCRHVILREISTQKLAVVVRDVCFFLMISMSIWDAYPN